MKKTFLFFALAFLLVGFSEAFAQNIVGTWEMTSMSFSTKSEDKKKQEFIQMMNEQVVIMKEKGLSMTMALTKNGKVNSRGTTPEGKKTAEKGTYKFENGVFTSEGDKNVMAYNNIKPVFSDNMITFTKKEEESDMILTTVFQRKK